MSFKCSFCFSKKFNKEIVYQHSKKIRFALCECGVWQNQTPIPKEKLTKFFNSNNFLKNKKKFKVEGYSDYFKEENNRKLTSYYRLEKLRKYIDIKSKTSLLKIGCSTGAFLYHFRKISKEITGIDLNKKFVAYGNKNYNLNIINGDFEKYSFKKKYDLIILFSVLENIPDLNLFFKKVKKLIKPNGHLILNYVPANNFIEKIQKKNYFMFRQPIYNYFNKKSFYKFFSQKGFKKLHEFSDIRYSTLEKIILLLDAKFINKLLGFFRLNQCNIKINYYPSKIVIFKNVNKNH
jgi:SAM-dependent methyltransferase